MTEDMTTAPESAHWQESPPVEELEQRLQRLEDAVAALCDTQALEDRVAARVSEKVIGKLPAATPVSDTQIAPVASYAPYDPEPAMPNFRDNVARGWQSTLASADTLSLLGDMWSDVRTFWAMIRDGMYPMTWLSRLIGLLPAAYLLWSMFAGFHNGILGAVGYIIDLLLLVPFLYIALKVWGRELRRYREFNATRRRR